MHTAQTTTHLGMVAAVCEAHGRRLQVRSRQPAQKRLHAAGISRRRLEAHHAHAGGAEQRRGTLCCKLAARICHERYLAGGLAGPQPLQEAVVCAAADVDGLGAGARRGQEERVAVADLGYGARRLGEAAQQVEDGARGVAQPRRLQGLLRKSTAFRR